MLPHPLALQRTLRPLKRRVPAPVGQELDEEATAHRIARLGAAPQWWLPVLRPATERWLTLHLVHDCGPTMPVWRPLVRELNTALAQAGVFRTVELHRLAPDGTVHRAGSPEPHSDGRTVTLLVSDCMGPQWREGPAGSRWYRTLRRWATRMPVAVLQPLPERLWRTTALPTGTARIAAPSPAAPNSAYTVDSYAMDDLAAPVLPLPVLEPSPAWLTNWAELVSNRVKAQLTGSVGLLAPSPPPAPLDDDGLGDVERLSAEELVLRFRSLASPQAFRLAGHLAVGRPELPVMRLVQAAIEVNPRPQHLAEVILSGFLRSTDGPPGAYAFRPGVREVLLRTLPHTARSRTTELVARAGALIDARAGVAPGEIPVVAPGEEGVSGSGEPIAQVLEESVTRLGGTVSYRGRVVAGRYRLLERLGYSTRIWRAEDTRSGGPVAVHLHPEDPSPHQGFLEEAETLAGLAGHPNLPRVLDFGVDGETPYLVVDFTPGITVTELIEGSGPKLPHPLLGILARQTAAGLAALHGAGLVRGRAGANGLLIRPDGTVVLSRIALGEEARRHSVNTDILVLGTFLKDSLWDEHRQVLHEYLSLTDEVLPAMASHEAATQRWAMNRLLSQDYEWLLHPSLPGYSVLGPLRLPSRPVSSPPGPLAQALACMLLLHPGRRLPHADIAAGLRIDPLPPADLTEALRAPARELANALGPGTLAELPDGYALFTGPGTVDLFQCEELLAQAQALRESGELQEARVRVVQALSLWYGDPLDGIPGPAAEAARSRILDLRLTLYALRADLGLQLDDVAQTRSDLQAILQEHPGHEELQQLHLRAVRAMVPETAAESEPYGPVIVIEANDLSDGRAREAIGDGASQLLSGKGIFPDQYEMTARPDGYLVRTDPGTDLLPVLAEARSHFFGILADLGTSNPPRLQVTFWHTAETAAPGLRTVLERVPDSADLVVAVSPRLYEEYVNRPGGPDDSFVPLLDQPDGPPVCWYQQLRFPTPDPGTRDLVRGPFLAHPGRLPVPDPEPGRTAVVLSSPGAPLTLFNPNDPVGKRPSQGVGYYEVDLTPHRSSSEVALPSSGRGAFPATVELTWQVSDPIAFIRGDRTHLATLLLDHFLDKARRITRRYSLQRAGAAQQALRQGFGRSPVPGLSVTYSVRLTPEEPSAADPFAGFVFQSPRTLLDEANTVLLGFDGPLTSLFSQASAYTAVLDLVSVVADHVGRRVLDSYDHPLDVLRAFAGTDVAQAVRTRLDQLELDAANSATQTSYAPTLVVALKTSGREVQVVTDVSEKAVRRCLSRLSLIVSVDGVHGRRDELDRLMPDPDCLRRALRASAMRDPRGVMIGTSVAERDAALELGIPFIGYAPSLADKDRLRAAGCDVTVRSLMELADAANTIRPWPGRN
ncbi:serine/threonine protein kinase [Streptomyces sp. 7R015]|uniref:Serine/threonine protein kinase n=2 Tax=Streptomyces cylindrosporus TaxID=2927583 RepID=A0ABS9XY74_9ACTN|nr:serine/threonine protein kinase [Streptomyces cylindrosporus]